MDSITQILSDINNFSKQSFIFSTHIELFKLFKSIPESIQTVLNDLDFIHHLTEATSHINWLVNFFEKNVTPALKKEASKSSTKEKMIEYADFSVDIAPIFKEREPEYVQLSFDDILKKKEEEGKSLKPVNRRTSNLSYEGTCPVCGAPNNYIYDNNKRGQFKCKACSSTFSTKITSHSKVGIYCPYCKNKLEKHHDRSGYIVYKCNNRKCSCYLNNKKLLDEGKAEHLKTSSNSYLLHYHYRDFKFNLTDFKYIRNTDRDYTKLSRFRYDSQVLGLILTYYVNYGLSARKTAMILKDIHNVSISHQTILNYASCVSNLIKPLLDTYQYKAGNVLCGDETYIKIRGKNHYIFFWSDPKSKIITSYTAYSTRDTKCAVQSIVDCFNHYKEIPEDMLLITDGNPIYNAAQLFLKLNDIKFDLKQVIGVKNKDETSKEYRPFKQIQERLNRTYKQNYHNTNGYDKIEKANEYLVLYVAFFNFLRKNSTINHRTPVQDERIDTNCLMQDQWMQLIQLSTRY